MSVIVRLHLGGPEGEIAGDAFLEAASAFLGLLDGAAQGAGDNPTWTVQDLAIGSANFAVQVAGEPRATETAERSVRTVLDGLSTLREHAIMPTAFSEGMVRKVRTLAQTLERHGVRDISIGAQTGATTFEDISVDEVIGRHAEQALRTSSESLGSVEGVFDRLYLRDRRREAGLIDEVTGVAVNCTFPKEMTHRIQEALLSKVVAWGVLRRNAAGQKLSLAIEDFETIGDPGPIEPVENFVGIFPEDWTGGRDSVEWVRGQRGS